jgi:hypothetical protein
MKKYDLYVADFASPPHVAVHLAGDRGALVAAVMVGVLTLEQATALATDIMARLNADGHGQ